MMFQSLSMNDGWCDGSLCMATAVLCRALHVLCICHYGFHVPVMSADDIGHSLIAQVNMCMEISVHFKCTIAAKLERES